MSKNYYREFITLKQDRSDYTLKGREALGRVVLEARGEVGKATVYVQDIKPQITYKLYLISSSHNQSIAVFIGSITVNDKGKGETKFSFNAENVSGSGIKIEDFATAVVLVPKGHEIIAPLAGFKDSPVSWKVNLIYADADKKMTIPVAVEPEPVMKAPLSEEPMVEKHIAEEPFIGEPEFEDELIHEKLDEAMPIEAEMIIVESNEAIETEAIGTEAVEVDAIETETVEVEAFEMEAVEIKAVEVESVETEIIETEAIKEEIIEEGVPILKFIEEVAEKFVEEKVEEKIEEMAEESVFAKENKFFEEMTLQNKQEKYDDPVEEIVSEAIGKEEFYAEDAGEIGEPVKKDFSVIADEFNKKMEALIEYQMLSDDDIEMMNTSVQTVRPEPHIFDSIFSTKEKIKPFKVQKHDAEWVIVTPKELALLPFNMMDFINQNLIISCYRKYRHLLLGKLMEDGETKYILGVPDSYHALRKHEAEEIGFKNFKGCDPELPMEGSHGYWLMFL